MSLHSQSRRLRVSAVKHSFRLLCLVSIAAVARQASARVEIGDLDTPQAAREINQRVTDPVSLTWSLKTKNTLNFLLLSGHGNHLQNQFQFQPTLPWALGDRFKLIARPEFTLVDDTAFVNASDQVRRTTGVGDTILDLAIGPRSDPWLVAVGPTFVFPTANLKHTGQGMWQVGPGGVLGYRVERWLAGVILQQWYSYAGNRSTVSEMHLQYIGNYVFGDGWNVGTSPTMTVNWKNAPGEQVTFPIGVTVGKVVRPWTLPVKLSIEADYCPVRSPDAPQAIIQLTVAPVIRSPQTGDW